MREKQRDLLIGLATIAALACLLITQWLANMTIPRRIGPTQIVRTTKEETEVDSEKRAAFEVAESSFMADMVAPGKARWRDISEAGFQRTPTGNFVSLEADVENGKGEMVHEHWIVRLEPGSNKILGKVCKEEAEVIGAGQE